MLNQEVTKHTVGKDKEFKKQLDEDHRKKEEEAGSPLKRKKTKIPVTVNSKVTTRTQNKVIGKIQKKIAQKLREKLGKEFGEGIMEALQDKDIEKVIKEMIKQDKIKILDQKNKELYQEEMKKVTTITADNVDGE